LDFANDSNEVKKGVFDLDRSNLELPREVLVQDFLHKRVASCIELLKKFLNQVQSQQVNAAVGFEVVLEKIVFVFVLDEVLWIILPAVEVDLRQEPVSHKLKNFPCSILPRLLQLNFRINNRCLKNVDVLFSCDSNLRLEIFEFDRGDQNATLLGVAAIIFIAEIVDRGVDYSVNSDQAELVETHGVDLRLEKHAGEHLDVSVERAVHQQALGMLYTRQMLQKSLDLSNQHLVVLFLLRRCRCLRNLFNALYVELQFRDQVTHDLHIAVVLRL